MTSNISSKSTNAFFSNLANRQTEKQTSKHGQKHVPPPLLEVMKMVTMMIIVKTAVSKTMFKDDIAHCSLNNAMKCVRSFIKSNL